MNKSITMFYPASLLAFISGFCLLFPSLILTAYMSDQGLSLQKVGWVSFLTLPYLCSFVWMPWIDYFSQAVLSRVKVLALGFFTLALCMSKFGDLSPLNSYRALMCLGFLVAMIAATLDHIIEAYRLAMLPPQFYKQGVSISLVFFRLGVVASGGGGLLLAATYGWYVAYQTAAIIMTVLGMLVLMLPQEATNTHCSLKSHQKSSWEFLLSVTRNTRFLSVLMTHRLSVFWLELMLPVFLMRWMGLGLFDIGVLYKVYGMLGLILGGVLVSVWMKEFKLISIMQKGLFLQAVICGIFALFSYVKVSYLTISLMVFFQCCLQGVFSTAATVWLMEKTKPDVAAFSFSIWYGLSSVGRLFVGPVAAALVESYGWGSYMSTGVMLALTSAYLLYRYSVFMPDAQYQQL